MSKTTSPHAWPGLTSAINEMIDGGHWAALSDAGRAVWLVLAKRANRSTGRCWPSVNTIARESGKSRPGAYRGIRELEKAGLVHRKNTSGGAPTCTTNYTLAIPVSPAIPVSQTTPLPVSQVRQRGIARDTRIRNESPIKSIADARASGGAKSRRRDLVFEAIAEACALPLDQLTTSARGQLNRAAKELRQVNAAPDEIHRRAEVYAGKYSRDKLTPLALAKHWPSLASDDGDAVALTAPPTEPPNEVFAA